jgi:hypothetical protein
MPFDPPLPKPLTAAEWTKHKGLIAKLVKGKTGLGENLKAVEAAYAKFEIGKPPATSLHCLDITLDIRNLFGFLVLDLVEKGFDGPGKASKGPQRGVGGEQADPGGHN